VLNASHRPDGENLKVIGREDPGGGPLLTILRNQPGLE